MHLFFTTTGYYTTSTQDYDIKWTMPQCVLTLRLIGLAFNVWDGQKRDVRTLSLFPVIYVLSHLLPWRDNKSHWSVLQEKLSDTQKQVALKERPSLLEIAAYAYFPGAFLIGPQFSMRRYLNYVNGQLAERVSNWSKHLRTQIEMKNTSDRGGGRRGGSLHDQAMWMYVQKKFFRILKLAPSNYRIACSRDCCEHSLDLYTWQYFKSARSAFPISISSSRRFRILIWSKSACWSASGAGSIFINISASG